MWSVKPWVLIVGGLVLAAGLGVVGVVVSSGGDELRSEARREWRDGAVEGIRGRVGEKGWVEGEVERVKGEAVARKGWGGWVGKEVLVMKNGEWVVFRNVCVKEKTGVKKDLFIGVGSDGKWYYSTFHFCVGMVVPLGDEQPGGLGEFVEGYFLREFEGKSDESLGETWDGGGSWGMAKVMQGRGG